MRYALRTYDYTLRVEMEGALTFADSRNFHRLLASMTKDKTMRSVIFALEKIYFMDSTGLALLITAFDMAKKHHMEIVFEAPQSSVLGLLAQATPYNALTIAA